MMIDAILLTLSAIIAGSGSDTAASPTPPVAATPASEQRYCVKSTITGSILERRECHTRAEWLKLGFDPLAKK